MAWAYALRSKLNVHTICLTVQAIEHDETAMHSLWNTTIAVSWCKAHILVPIKYLCTLLSQGHNNVCFKVHSENLGSRYGPKRTGPKPDWPEGCPTFEMTPQIPPGKLDCTFKCLWQMTLESKDIDLFPKLLRHVCLHRHLQEVLERSQMARWNSKWTCVHNLGYRLHWMSGPANFGPKGDVLPVSGWLELVAQQWK